MQNNIYLVIVKEKNGKRKAGVWTIPLDGTDVYAELQSMDGIKTAWIFKSKKLAMDVSEKYNQNMMNNGTYIYSERSA